MGENGRGVAGRRSECFRAHRQRPAPDMLDVHGLRYVVRLAADVTHLEGEPYLIGACQVL